MIFSSEYPKDSQAHHLYRHWSVFERYGEIMTNLPYSIILDDYGLKLGNKDKIKWKEIEKVEGFHVGNDSIKLVITLKNSQIIKYNYQEKDNTPYLYIKAYHEKYSK